MQPFVSIITPVKAEKDYITECLTSLLSLDYPKDSYEILMVLDKNAIDEVKKILKVYEKREASRVRVIQSNKAGSAANRNLGVTKASKKAEYFAFTDADCIADKRWLSTLVNRIEKKGKDEVDVVGGVNLVPGSDNRLAKTIGAMEQTLLGGGGTAQSSIMRKEKIVPSVPNCNAIYKRKLWDENRQDESLITGQDGEFNYRLWSKGARFVAIPDAVVWHHRTRTFKGFVKRMLKYGEATARILRKHKEARFLRLRWYGMLPVISLISFIILFIISFFSLPVLFILSGLVMLYILLDFITALNIIIKTGMFYSEISFFLIPFQHVLYAVGFIKGVITSQTL